MLAGPVTDGWDYQDNMLTKYHKKIGYDVTMITSQWIWSTEGQLIKYENSNYINADGVKVVRLPIKGKDSFSKKFKQYKNLNTYIEKESPDILFVHGCQFLDVGVICRYLKEHKNVKVYVDNHADFSNSATNFLSRNILHKMLWKYYAHKIAPFVSRFYGVLPARVDFLTDIYKLPKEKCELLVMGADNEKVEKAQLVGVREEIRKKNGISKEDFLIVTGGKIDVWKKQTILLMQALHNLNSNKVKLIVFGSVASELKQEVLALSDGIKVQYIGWIDSEKSYYYFAAADLVIFPGRHSVFWEQVAGMGIPMVCKYWEGTTHVDFGGNVKFLRKDSVSEIQNVIEEIIDNEEVYNEMLKVSQGEGKKAFLYQEIAERAIKL